jgi:hypothetical protein
MCSSVFCQFDIDYLINIRATMMELSHHELDLVIMSQVMALPHGEKETRATKHIPHERQRMNTKFFHRGQHICRTTFLFLHAISKHRLDCIIKSYQLEGFPSEHMVTRGEIRLINSAMKRSIVSSHLSRTMQKRMQFYYQEEFQATNDQICNYYLLVLQRGRSTICMFWPHRMIQE